jgi:hypothetical protein
MRCRFRPSRGLRILTRYLGDNPCVPFAFLTGFCHSICQQLQYIVLFSCDTYEKKPIKIVLRGLSVPRPTVRRLMHKICSWLSRFGSVTTNSHESNHGMLPTSCVLRRCDDSVGTETDDAPRGMNHRDDDEGCCRQLLGAKERDYFRLCQETYLLHTRVCVRTVDYLSTRESTVWEDREKRC